MKQDGWVDLNALPKAFTELTGDDALLEEETPEQLREKLSRGHPPGSEPDPSGCASAASADPDQWSVSSPRGMSPVHTDTHLAKRSDGVVIVERSGPSGELIVARHPDGRELRAGDPAFNPSTMEQAIWALDMLWSSHTPEPARPTRTDRVAPPVIKRRRLR